MSASAELPQSAEVAATTSSPGQREHKVALVVGASQYLDAGLRRLRAPGRDANEFAHVLADPAIGGFDVVTLLNSTAEGVRRTLADFCAEAHPGDLMLVYLSCHGLLDESGRLYYAMADTQRQSLAATALPATWLNERLEDSRCKRQVLILDCCHSGAFARGGKGPGALDLRLRFEGRGRAVLTASGAQEYSFEGEDVVGSGATSVFTHALIAGLRTGDADLDGDGQITVAEMYHHAYDRVRESGHPQSPELWSTGTAADLVVARRGDGLSLEVTLPADLLQALRSARIPVRKGAVAALTSMLDESPEQSRVARQALEIVAALDIAQVAALAEAALRSAGLRHGDQPRSAELPGSIRDSLRSDTDGGMAPSPQLATTSVPSAGNPEQPDLETATSPVRRRAREPRSDPDSSASDSSALRCTMPSDAPRSETLGDPVIRKQPMSTVAVPALPSTQDVFPSTGEVTAVAGRPPRLSWPLAGKRMRWLAAVAALVLVALAGVFFLLRMSDTGAVSSQGDKPASTEVGNPPTLVPGAVPWVHVSGATPSTMALAWGQAPGAASYELGYRAIDGSGTFQKSGYSLRGDAVPVVFHALAPDTIYEFWVRGVNAAGAGPAIYGKERTRKPSEAAQATISPSSAPTEAVPGAIPWIHLSKPTSTTITMSWGQAPGGLQYDVSWRALDGSGKAFNKSGYTWHGDADSITFHGLEPSTVYEFSVRARNNGGLGAPLAVQGKTLP
jgi:hypothetical protein